MAFNRLLYTCLFGAFLFLLPGFSIAQISRKEERALKKEMRKLSPEEYLKIKQDSAEQQSRILELTREKLKLQSQMEEKEEHVRKIKDEMMELKRDLMSSETQQKEETTTSWEEGVVFRVQIGAYKNYDISDQVGSGEDLKVEEEGPYKIYVLGNFRKYEEANQLKKRIRKMGVKDAFVTQFKDGKRVSLKEVLEVAIGN